MKIWAVPKTGPGSARAAPARLVSNVRAGPCGAQPFWGQPSTVQGTARLGQAQSGLSRAACGWPTDPTPYLLFLF